MIRLNKNKNIGSVIYIVEGEKTEQYIIKRIFNELLDYDLIKVNSADGIKRYRSISNKYSRITVITSKHPQIISLEKYEEFFDNIYKKLAIEYDIDVENSAIYYIFDRDRLSNPQNVIQRLIKKYYNAYDNENEMNGVLLLSYPAIEAYYLNGHNSKRCFGVAKDAKIYVKRLKYNYIDNKTIKIACKNMINILYNKFDYKYNIDTLNDFKEVNKLIFDKEEDHYFRNSQYITLSSLSFSLLDLGVLEIINKGE